MLYICGDWQPYNIWAFWQKSLINLLSLFAPQYLFQFPRECCRSGRSLNETLSTCTQNFLVTFKSWGIEGQKSSLKMLIFPSNCQFGTKFWIRPDEDEAFLVNTHSKWSPGTRMQPWTSEPLNPWTPTWVLRHGGIGSMSSCSSG